jgi:hypothetical protein
MQKVAEKMGEVDRANTSEMKEILNVHGWMRISVFGKEADGDAWLLVQQPTTIRCSSNKFWTR